MIHRLMEILLTFPKVGYQKEILFTLNHFFINKCRKLKYVFMGIVDTQRYRVQSDSASDYGGYKRKKKSTVAGRKADTSDAYGNRLPSRPQSSCAITQIGVPERRW